MNRAVKQHECTSKSPKVVHAQLQPALGKGKEGVGSNGMNTDRLATHDCRHASSGVQHSPGDGKVQAPVQTSPARDADTLPLQNCPQLLFHKQDSRQRALCVTASKLKSGKPSAPHRHSSGMHEKPLALFDCPFASHMHSFSSHRSAPQPHVSVMHKTSLTHGLPALITRRSCGLQMYMPARRIITMTLHAKTPFLLVVHGSHIHSHLIQ